MAFSLVLKKLIASNLLARPVVTSPRTVAHNLLMRSGVQSIHTSAYTRVCTSKLLTCRSLVPFLSPTSAAVSSSVISRFICRRDFHVDVSHENSVMGRICRLLDPRGWWSMVFKYEDNSVKVNKEKVLFSFQHLKTDEGLALKIQMHGAQSRNLKVSVEDHTLFCSFTKAYENTTVTFRMNLPNKKTYQPSDVKAKMKNGVLLVTFTNLTIDDVD